MHNGNDDEFDFGGAIDNTGVGGLSLSKKIPFFSVHTKRVEALRFFGGTR